MVNNKKQTYYQILKELKENQIIRLKIYTNAHKKDRIRSIHKTLADHEQIRLEINNAYSELCKADERLATHCLDHIRLTHTLDEVQKP